MGEGTTGAALVSNLNSLALNLSGEWIFIGKYLLRKLSNEINTIHYITFLFLGLFIGPAIKTFAPRRVAFAGCFLTSFGLLMCSVSTRLWHVIICYSIIVSFCKLKV